MISIGLDPSLSGYGWCVYDSSKSGFDKLLDIGRWCTDNTVLEVQRYTYLRSQVTELISRTQDKYGPVPVGVETPPIESTAHSTERLYALYVYNQEAFLATGVDVVFIAPLQLQLFAKLWGSGTVKGPWGKNDMKNMVSVDMLEEYPYPKHADYYDPSPTKLDRNRAKGYAQSPLQTVILSKYDKATVKKLKVQHDKADAYHAARFSNRFFRYMRGTLPEGDLTPSEWDMFARSYTKRDGTVEETGIKFKEGSRFIYYSKFGEKYGTKENSSDK